MPRPPSIPKPYTKSGQLAVCLRDPRTGYRRTVYLGASGTPEARREYARVLAEWEAGDRVVTAPTSKIRHKVHRPEAVTVAELILGYFRTVKARHSHNGKLTTHGLVVRSALRVLREQAGDHAAGDFGPKTLRQVRDSMVASGRFSRKTVNENTRYIVAAFKWAVAEELIPVRVYDALQCLPTIRRIPRGKRDFTG